MDYRDQDGRQPMLMFMELPSAKIYPEYYKVIKQPIDMTQIENNIQNEKYRSQDEILADVKLMFANCRVFNEPGSLIYEDAVNLEKVLVERVADMGPLPEKKRVLVKKGVNKSAGSSTPGGAPSGGTGTSVAVLQKMRILYNTIKETSEPKTGRLLSAIFQRLPSRHDYPDYYEVIRKPMDMEMIGSKLRYSQYEHMDEMVADFMQMFDNACKYNEPDSHIYKDALSLQRMLLQTKMHLREDEDAVPDVPAAVQELLTSLFTSVYNHQDEEGRCFSDSMAELPEHDELPNGTKVRAISLDLIKRRLDSGQYRRLDMFQEDLFACLDRGRQLSRTDSQVFEDSIELQSYFIRQRDEICRNGDLLHSPALNYSLLDLSTQVEELRQQKLQKEIPEHHEEPDYTESEDKKSGGDVASSSTGEAAVKEEEEDDEAAVDDVEAMEDDVTGDVSLGLEEKPTKFQCLKCDRRFVNLGNLARHAVTHFEQSCDVCQKKFTSPTALAKHRRQHGDCAARESGGGGSIVVPDTCHKCGRVFTKHTELVKHLESEHNIPRSESSPWCCRFCNKRMMTKLSLSIHERIHTGQRPFTCDWCGQGFRSKANLLQHHPVHTGVRKYSCNVCGKAFSRKSFVTTHMRVHTGDRPYGCDVCQAKFTQVGDMRRHRKKHEEKSRGGIYVKPPSREKQSNLLLSEMEEQLYEPDGELIVEQNPVSIIEIHIPGENTAAAEPNQFRMLTYEDETIET
uniref:Protein polybromo-1 n=1 Tax=Cacopsylla melanoneura TaxID=428564 RepID=A0A8D9EME9_9HEMI